MFYFHFFSNIFWFFYSMWMLKQKDVVGLHRKMNRVLFYLTVINFFLLGMQFGASL